MDFPAKQEFDELRSYGEPFCVTIYMPFVEPSGTANPNRIELSNLLRQAEAALRDTSMPERDVKKTLRPARELLNSRELSPNYRGSLALFMHSGFFRYYHMPDDSTPRVLTVGQGFNLEPLLAAMRANRSYFVLALGHKDVRLYEGDHFNLKPVKLRGFPADMRETLRIDENPKSEELHPIAAAGAGKGSEAYHGQYNVSQVDKNMLEEFFRTIDRRLHSYLASKDKPLILAGVNYLLPIYRKVNTYSRLWPDGIPGNIKNDQPKDILNKAWALITTPNPT